MGRAYRLYPLAVLRSRLQLQKQHTVYRNTLHAFIDISKKEGFRGLYRVRGLFIHWYCSSCFAISYQHAQELVGFTPAQTGIHPQFRFHPSRAAVRYKACSVPTLPCQSLSVVSLWVRPKPVHKSRSDSERKINALCALAPHGRSGYATASRPRLPIWPVVPLGLGFTWASADQTKLTLTCLVSSKAETRLSFYTGLSTPRGVEHSTSGSSSTSPVSAE